MSLTSSKPKHKAPVRDGYECLAYAKDILDGKIEACKEIKQLCAMIKPRLESGVYKMWHYDPERALRPVRFIERFCCNPEGKPGQRIVLQPFQLFWVEVVFGFIGDDGYRQFQEVLIVMGRKSGKTTLQAALGLYMLTKDGEQAPQCYSAATAKPQASLLYGSMINMVRQSPMLQKRLIKGKVPARNEDGLKCMANGGYFMPLSSSTKSLDGLNVHFAAIDEIAAVTNRDVFDLIKQAISSRNQPLIVEITTNGFVRDNLFDQQLDYGQRLLEGKFEDDRFLPLIYKLDTRAEWLDSTKWVKANPGLGTIKKKEYLETNVNKAKNDPGFLPTVMVKDFDMPENRAQAWLNYEKAVNEATFDWKEMGFRYCVIGFDASDTVDLTSAQALMMRPDDEHIYEMSMYWIPEAQIELAKKQLRGREERDHVPYDLWIEQGLMRKVPGNVIDHRCIFEWIEELKRDFDVYTFALGFDPWHLINNDWEDEAKRVVGKDRAERVRFGAQTLSIPMKEIEKVYEQNLIVDNHHPINEWCRLNVGKAVDKNDNWQPVKGNGSAGRIDGWAAEICAYICLQRHKEDYMAII